MRAIILAVLAAITLSGCEQDYADQFQALEKFAAKGKIGSTNDYWLTKRNFAGEADRVALVFGIAGDLEFCADLAELYMQKYPSDEYFCLAAN